MINKNKTTPSKLTYEGD